MLSKTWNDLIEQANALTLDEQLRLAAYLIQRAIKSSFLYQPVSSRMIQPHRKWREIRGLGRPSILGEDAQAWVSRTRHEADEHRARQWSSKP